MPHSKPTKSGAPHRAIVAAVLPVAGFATLYVLGTQELRVLGLKRMAIGPADPLFDGLTVLSAAAYLAVLLLLAGLALRDRRHLIDQEPLHRIVIIVSAFAGNLILGLAVFAAASFTTLGPIQD